MKGKKRKDKKKRVFGQFRIPLPEKTGGYHKPKKGKGSYKRHPKHKKAWDNNHAFFY